jgi:hypothetical protein
LSRLADVERPLVEERDHPVRPWVLAGLLGLLVLMAAWVFYYSPLEGGQLRCEPPAELVPAPESEQGATGRERCLLASTSEPYEVVLGLTLSNTGRLPIDVEGFAPDPPVAELLSFTDPDPFPLRAGESRQLDLVVEVHACGPTRGERLLTLEELPVRSRFLGIPRTTGADLDIELSVLRTRC